MRYFKQFNDPKIISLYAWLSDTNMGNPKAVLWCINHNLFVMIHTCENLQKYHKSLPAFSHKKNAVKGLQDCFQLNGIFSLLINVNHAVFISLAFIPHHTQPNTLVGGVCVCVCVGYVIKSQACCETCAILVIFSRRSR